MEVGVQVHISMGYSAINTPMSLIDTLKGYSSLWKAYRDLILVKYPTAQVDKDIE